MCEPSRVAVHIERKDVLSDFVCSEPSFTEFFHEKALFWEDAGFARTYVVRRDSFDPPEFPQVLGYYTLCMARLSKGDLQNDGEMLLVRQDPAAPNNLPAALLGMMAKDRRIPKELRLGEWMVGDAVSRIARVSAEIGCALVVLDALNDHLVNYYRTQFGFIESRRSRRMYLSWATAVEAMSAPL